MERQRPKFPKSDRLYYPDAIRVRRPNAGDDACGDNDQHLGLTDPEREANGFNPTSAANPSSTEDAMIALIDAHRRGDRDTATYVRVTSR